MSLLEEEKKLHEKLISYRRELHRNPELSGKEFETTKRIRQWLKEANIDMLDYPLASGVIAEISGDNPGPTIALRSDIDALPINEETGLPFASENSGIMHACGHDFHTASILGAAILINKRKSELKGKVRIIFQPAEETAQGAADLCKLGILENVEAIFGFHNRPDLPVGTIGIKSGALMASVDRFEIDVIGVGGHAGMPNNCVDPIVIASEIVSGLQFIVSRNLSSFYNVVLSITRFQAGNTWNVIPDKAELEGTVRTFQDEARASISQLMKRTAEGIASAFGGKIDFRWFSYLPVVNNDPQFTEVATEVAKELGYTVVEAQQNQGGEDFAFYQSKIPGFYVWIGVDGTKEWHHPAYTLNEDALPVAANYFANLAFKVLSSWK
ncbi:M20 peptidase aminoacylase family protein [Clostridium sp. DJ247]|uniref:M20 peptidase aminoacylase family protein n=1 Tax=Clostridium sp. DJ247 TaxID=2726188 RepID=UPI0016298C3A|nr:M20 peptidase aminoacylase family protein [Clostridium sp. DJ247]MBC2582493.1 amidohydrolase [Clostridium sp. DJ247]